MCLIRVRAKLCRNGPDLRIPGITTVTDYSKHLPSNTVVYLLSLFHTFTYYRVRSAFSLGYFVLQCSLNERMLCERMIVFHGKLALFALLTQKITERICCL